MPDLGHADLAGQQPDGAELLEHALQHIGPAQQSQACLVDVAFDAQLPLDAAVLAHDGSEESARRTAVRSMAIIRFKNGIDKHWRSRVAGCVERRAELGVTSTMPRARC